MTRVRGFLAFLQDFVVGDDPAIAAAVVLALGLTAALAAGGAAVWWVLPLAVVSVLSWSVLRATRR
ncbi:MAG TPA: hypothetical protein VII98_11395 [Solirubrobacteraceae bacterium]